MDRMPGWVLWFTGLPASGKTTLARALRHRLSECGISSILLDSDELRGLITPDATYAPGERDWFYDRLVELAVWLERTGENVIIAATGNQRRYRAAARARLAPRFAEVWVRCPIGVCRARDPKALYAQADAGLIHGLPGADIPYEAPEAPEVIIDSDQLTPEAAIEVILAALPLLQPALHTCAASSQCS
jgi:adenylyl-sulfate kinase